MFSNSKLPSFVTLGATKFASGTDDRHQSMHMSELVVPHFTTCRIVRCVCHMKVLHDLLKAIMLHDFHHKEISKHVIC